jgi:hypothetical protein
MGRFALLKPDDSCILFLLIAQHLFLILLLTFYMIEILI